jgi:hypothetical protein
LLGDVETCPRCGAPVRVAVGAGPAAITSTAPPAPAVVPAPAPSWPPAPPAPAAPPASGSLQAPSYGRLSIPSPIGPAPASAPAPSGPAPAPAPPAHDAWQPYVVDTPVKTAAGHKPWARVALAVVVVIVVAAAIMHLRADPLPAGTSDYVAGKGVTYTSPDGAFQVLLPQQPQMQHEMLSINGVNAPLYMGIVQTNSYVIGVASIVSPVPFKRSGVDDALDEMTSQGVKNAHGTSVRKVSTMHGDQPAVDLRFKANGHVGHMLAVATDSSVVLMFVYAKSGTDALYKALDNSLLVR